jgi:hypothetical protein
VRLIRAKKPWALAASALLMLGFSGLFLGDYRVLAKVSTKPFQDAVKQANDTSSKGAQYKTEFETAKGEWSTINEEGKKLVAGTTDRARWPEFLKVLRAHLPDPVRDRHLDPNKPENQRTLEHLRVHIDGIKPAWRQDVGAEWFSLAPPSGLSTVAKDLMHQVDRGTPPTGPGWVIQIIGHHYNPYPDAAQRKLPEGSPQRTDYGPYGYLIREVLPRLNTPDLRLYGVHHVALAWETNDKEWTNEKGNDFNNMASNAVPILDRAKPPVAATGEAGAGGAAGGQMPGMDMMKGNMGGGMSVAIGGGMMPGMERGMYGGMPGMGMQGSAAQKNIVKHTRTDFLIQFVWQPPKPEEQPKTPEERREKLAALRKQLNEAEKNSTMITAQKEAEIEAASKKASQEVQNLVTKGAAAPAAGAPGAAPAPGAGAPAPGTPAPAAGAPAPAAGAPAPGAATPAPAPAATPK